MDWMRDVPRKDHLATTLAEHLADVRRSNEELKEM